jgi:tetratricopeptide (TPR) repeat protein
MNKINNSYRIKKLLEKSLTYCKQGQLLEAKTIYHELLNIVPSHPDVLSNLGVIEMQIGDIYKGINYLEKSLEVNPRQPKAISNLGNGFLELNKNAEAINCYDLAIKLDHKLPEPYYNKARALKAITKYSEAIFNYQQAIKLNPYYFEALVNLGFLYYELKEFTKALDQYNSALSLNPQSSEAFYNRGIVYEKLGHPEKALSDYDSATKINPKNFTAFSSKGLLFIQLKDFRNAIFNFDCAIEANGNYYEAYFNKAILLLKLNDYKKGWQLFESRWQSVQENCFLRTSKPMLDRCDVIQKKILIWAEQGIGDQVMYTSLLKEVTESPNMFIVTADLRIISLLERSFKDVNNIKFLPSMTYIDESLYDFHLPLGGLGKFFRNSIDDFQSQPIGYLIADSKKTNYLKQKLKKEKIFNCGISWKSENKKVGAIKSLSLSKFFPIFQLSNLDIIDLQYGNTKVEKKLLSDNLGIEVISVDEVDNFNDIDGLASLINSCDFIVTSSCVTAHLAGALGKNTYLLVPYSGAGRMWYWHEGLKTSLWYPSIQIFSQAESGDWSVPINEIKEKIVEEILHD